MTSPKHSNMLYVFSNLPIFSINSHQGFPSGSVAKNLPANAGDKGLIPRSKDPLEKEMATHSSIFAWEISWTEEPGGPQSMGLQKSRTQLSD